MGIIHTVIYAIVFLNLSCTRKFKYYTPPTMMRISIDGQILNISQLVGLSVSERLPSIDNFQKLQQI